MTSKEESIINEIKKRNSILETNVFYSSSKKKQKLYKAQSNTISLTFYD